MRQRSILIASVIALLICSPATALYSVALTGQWPKSWPDELETLRDNSRTLIGPVMSHRHYAISFASRDEFESAWPHLLKVRNNQSPIFLVRPPNFFLSKESKAGVIVHTPQVPNQPAVAESPSKAAGSPRSRWMMTTYLELVVDGDIVDLNRLKLPPEVVIIDRRFPE